HIVKKRLTILMAASELAIGRVYLQEGESMSMIAQFVQVSPAQLTQLMSDLEGIEHLFATLSPASEVPAASMEKLINLAEAQRKQFIERGTQMLESTLARMDPGLREEMSTRLQRLGLDVAGLGKGEGGEALIRLMRARLGGGGKGQGAAPSPNSK